MFNNTMTESVAGSNISYSNIACQNTALSQTVRYRSEGFCGRIA